MPGASSKVGSVAAQEAQESQHPKVEWENQRIRYPDDS